MSEHLIGIKIKVDGGSASAALASASEGVKNFGEAGQKAGKQANQGMSDAASGADKLNRQGAQLQQQFGRLLAVFGGFTGIKGLVRTGDDLKLLDDRLRLVTSSEREFAAAKAQLIAVSQRQTSSLADTVTLYTRLANATKDSAYSQKSLLDTVEAVSAALRISGASAAEAASAQLQLSQAIGSGRLAGEEFRAISEAAPKILDVLAEYMGKARGELKGLAAEGQITADTMVAALSGARNQLVEQSSKISITAGAALSQMMGQLAQQWHRINQATGLNSGLAQAMIGIGNQAQLVVQILGTALVAALARYSTGMVAASLQTGKLAAAMMSVRSVGAMQTMLSGIVGLLGGPAGIIAMLVTGAVAWATFGAGAESGAQKAAKAADELIVSYDEMIQRMQTLTKEQREVQITDYAAAMKAQTDAIAENINQIEGMVAGAATATMAAEFDKMRTAMTQGGEGATQAFESAKNALAGMGVEMRALTDTGLLMMADQLKENFSKAFLEVKQGKQSLTALLETYAPLINANENLKKSVTELVAKNQEREQVEQSLAALQAVLKGTATEQQKALLDQQDGLTQVAAATDKASEKLGEYVDNLKKSIVTAGMNNAQLAEYEAKSLGASDAQIAQANTLGALKDAQESYADALKEGKQGLIDAAKAAYTEIANQAAVQAGSAAASAEYAIQLELVRQGLISMAEAASIASAAGRGMSEQVFGDLMAGLNTAGKNAPKGGGGQKKDEAGDYFKNAAAETANMLAMAAAYAQGTEAVRQLEMAQKAEADTLKIGAKNRQAVVAAVEAEAAARDKLDIAKMVAEIEQENNALKLETVALAQGESALAAYNVAKELGVRLAGKNAAALVQETARLKELLARNADLKEIKTIVEANATAQEQYNSKMQRLSELLKVATAEYGQYSVEVDRIKQGIEELNESVDPTAQIFEDTASSIYESWSGMFEDVFQNGTNAFKNMGESIKKTFLSLCAQLAAQALAKPILLPIITTLGGVMGVSGGNMGAILQNLGLSTIQTQGTDGSAGKGGGISDFLGLGKLWDAGKGVWGALTGGIGAGATAIGSAVSGIFGGTIGLGAGSAAMGAATATGGITGGMGAFAGMAGLGSGAATAGATGAAAAGTGLLGSVGAMAAAALPVIGIVAGLAGMLFKKKPSDKSAAGDYDFATDELVKTGMTGHKYDKNNHEARDKIFDAVQGVRDYISEAFDTSFDEGTLRAEIGSRDGLRLTIDGVKTKYETADELMAAAIGAVVSKATGMDQVLKDLAQEQVDGGLDATALMTYIGVLSKAQELFKEDDINADWYRDMMAEQSKLDVSALANFVVALSNAKDLISDIDLGDVFKDLIQAQSEIKGGDLAGYVANLKVIHAVMQTDIADKYATQLAKANRTLTDVMHDQSIELYKLITAFDGSAEATAVLASALQDQIGIAMAMLDGIHIAQSDITSTVAKSIEDIKLSTMDDGAKYDYWKGKAEDQFQTVMDSTDWQQVKQAFDNANQFAMNAYNTMDDEGKQANASEFIDWLTKLETAAQEKLGDAEQAVITDVNDLQAALGTALTAASAGLTGAAAALAGAATALSGAADKQNGGEQTEQSKTTSDEGVTGDMASLMQAGMTAIMPTIQQAMEQSRNTDTPQDTTTSSAVDAAAAALQSIGESTANAISSAVNAVAGSLSSAAASIPKTIDVNVSVSVAQPSSQVGGR